MMFAEGLVYAILKKDKSIVPSIKRLSRFELDTFNTLLYRQTSPLGNLITLLVSVYWDWI